MCGFVGSYLIKDDETVTEGINRIRYRGPDEMDVTKTPQGVLGHTRLSIVDVKGSHQPMTDGNRWMVYNGEVYNFENLKKKLHGDWHTRGDTEVVMQAIKEAGIDAVNSFEGMFAFALFSDGVLLARDPIGIKPLYTIETSKGLYFASEMKALPRHTGEIKEFPAGTWWSKSTGFVKYFRIDDLQWNTQQANTLSSSEMDHKIYHTLENAVQKRLIADPGIPVGVSLSGGLDSSVIAALARQGRDNLDTFVVGMEGSNDVHYSFEVASNLHTRHHSYIYSFDEMIRVLPEVIYHLESYDAALVRSAIPNYFLARLASEYVRVILTGEGADELFGGYEYLSGVKDPSRFQREIWTITNNLHNTNLQRTDRMTMAHSIEGRVPFLDRDMIRLALSIPPELKFHQGAGSEKSILRRAFKGLLPDNVLYRPKQKFSQGAGSRDQMAEYANENITHADYARALAKHPEARLRSKEELFYFNIFREQFGEEIPLTSIGRTRSVTAGELN